MPGHGHQGRCEHEHTGEQLDEKGVQFSLYQKIDIDHVTCLNESADGSGKLVFKPWENRLDKEKFVESDVDPELLFNIPFLGSVKIKSIVVIGGENESHPKTMKLFVNRPQMTFDNTTVKPDKDFELARDETGLVEYTLPMTKFSSVYHLAVFFPTNHGSPTTKIYYIGLAGEFLTPWREPAPVVCAYEARPMPQDHKGEIKEVNQFPVM